MKEFLASWHLNVRYASFEALSAFKNADLALLFHQLLYLHSVSNDLHLGKKVIHITRDHLLNQMPNYTSLSTLQRHLLKLQALGILSIVDLKRGDRRSEKGFIFHENVAKEFLRTGVKECTQVNLTCLESPPIPAKPVSNVAENLNTSQNDLCKISVHNSKWVTYTSYIIYIFYLDILGLEKIAHGRIVQLLKSNPNVNQEFETFWSLYLNSLGSTQCQKSEALKKWKRLGKNQIDNVMQNLLIAIAQNLLLKCTGDWIAKPKHQSTFINSMKHCSDGLDEVEHFIMDFDDNLKTNPKTKIST